MGSRTTRPTPGATPPSGEVAPGLGGDNEVGLHLRLLGAFQVTVGGQPIPEQALRLRKARSLVKILALHPGQRLPRKQVLEILWPELDLLPAENNLRGALHIVRRAFAPRATIVKQEDALALEVDGPLWLDVTAFEAAAV